ncbi:MAG: RNA methyltransferase substrate-binding domain-containing protein, partial [Chitinophagaceae bacterium]
MKNFRQQQRPKKSSLVIGRDIVINAISKGQQLDRIYLETKAHGQDIDEIKKLAAKYSIPINYVPAAKLNSFNVTGHEGCIGQIARVQYHNLQEVISFVVEKGESPLFLI